jgi:hypothetical protein
MNMGFARLVDVPKELSKVEKLVATSRRGFSLPLKKFLRRKAYSVQLARRTIDFRL